MTATRNNDGDASEDDDDDENTDSEDGGGAHWCATIRSTAVCGQWRTHIQNKSRASAQASYIEHKRSGSY